MVQEIISLPTDFDRPLPNWVPTPVQERAILKKDRTEWFKIINKELHQDLEIQEHLPNTKPEQVNRFYDHALQSIMETANELHLPIPRTGVKPNWRQYELEKSQEKLPDHDAFVSPDEYLIHFSPEWIAETIELKPFSQKIEIDLVVRHEMLHFWEIIHLQKNQEQINEKLKLIRRERPEIYKEVKQQLTEREMRAQLFELEGLKKQDTKTIKQFLYKSLILLLKKAEILRREKRRKQLHISF